MIVEYHEPRKNDLSYYFEYNKKDKYGFERWKESKNESR